jgi:hypothetical protein
MLQREKGEHEQQVPHVYRLGLAMLGPHRGMAPACAVPVLQVVVNQGGVVQQLAGGGPADSPLAPDAEHVQRGKRQPGAEPLPACRQVTTHHCAGGIPVPGKPDH